MIDAVPVDLHSRGVRVVEGDAGRRREHIFDGAFIHAGAFVQLQHGSAALIEEIAGQREAQHAHIDAALRGGGEGENAVANVAEARIKATTFRTVCVLPILSQVSVCDPVRCTRPTHDFGAATKPKWTSGVPKVHQSRLLR